MKKHFTHISLLILSVIVIFLSIGVTISKMQCSGIIECPEDGKLFLGKEVTSCIEQQEIACDMILNELSCCKKKEVPKSCCPNKEDSSCESEATDIQFHFETLVTSFEFKFKELSTILYTCFLHDKACAFKQKFNYSSSIFLLILYKPELPEIQSFLL